MKSFKDSSNTPEQSVFVSFEQISHQLWRIEMMEREVLRQILLIKTVQSTSAKMYYVLFTKILQGGDTTSGTVLHKRCSRICDSVLQGIIPLPPLPQKHLPIFSTNPPLNLETAQFPLYIRFVVTPPPLKIGFLSKPHDIKIFHP